MRSQPSAYELASPGTLAGVLDLLEREPGQWTPIAGGTEIMVQLSAGRLNVRRMVNLWNLPELREIRESDAKIAVGGGCTFAQLRAHAGVREHFPLLAQAASWLGGIANQNRATIAGNIVNASPAADSSPVLLAYEAEVELVSAQGRRTVAYSDFHLGYKKTALRANELVLAIHLPKRYAGWFSYGQKTGARNAQAISKVCIAAVGRIAHGRVEAIQIGMGAVAAVPLRLRATEDVLRDSLLSGNVVAEARRVLMTEIAPIDDIRSSREYRRCVAGNVLEEMLDRLRSSQDAV